MTYVENFSDMGNCAKNPSDLSQNPRYSNERYALFDWAFRISQTLLQDRSKENLTAYNNALQAIKDYEREHGIEADDEEVLDADSDED